MIQVRVGPLHTAEAEGILRPVSAELASVTGAGRDVEIHSGEGIRDRLVALGGLPVGGAVVTPGGDLAVPFLIHVVVQSMEEPVTETSIHRALVNGLRRASEWEMETLALPPLGTGAGNLDPDDAARIMVPIVLEHMATHDFPGTVTVTVPNEYEQEVFQAAIDRAKESGGAEGESRPEVPS